MAKANRNSTRAVARNLDKDYWSPNGRSSLNGRAFEHMGSDRETFERNGRRYLLDKSELRSSTIDSANWDEVFEIFKKYL